MFTKFIKLSESISGSVYYSFIFIFLNSIRIYKNTILEILILNKKLPRIILEQYVMERIYAEIEF